MLLLHHLLDLLQGEFDIEVAEEAGQVVLGEVEHEVEGGLVAAVRPADLDQVDDVVVVEELEDADLPAAEGEGEGEGEGKGGGEGEGEGEGGRG